jgi:hypothetical protein
MDVRVELPVRPHAGATDAPAPCTPSARATASQVHPERLADLTASQRSLRAAGMAAASSSTRSWTQLGLHPSARALVLVDASAQGTGGGAGATSSACCSVTSGAAVAVAASVDAAASADSTGPTWRAQASAASSAVTKVPRRCVQPPSVTLA